MDIIFSNKLYLFFIPLIILPILIYFFTKYKIKKIEISNIDIIKLAIKKTMLKNRLRTIFILLCRILIVLLIILLFAEPIYYKATFAKNKLKHTLIVVDDSASMRYVNNNLSLLGKAKEIAKEYIDLKNEFELCKIYSFTDILHEKNTVFESDKNKLKSKIDNILPTYSSGNIYDILKKIIKVSENKIIILSDFKNKQAKNKGSFNDLQNNDLDIICIDVSCDYDKNVAVYDISAEDKFISVPLNTKVKMFNNSSLDYKNLGVSFFVKGKLKDRKIIDVNLNKLESIEFISKTKDIGNFFGEITIPNDAFDIDNKRYFAFNVKDKINIILVDGDPKNTVYEAESYYLARALMPHRIMSYINLKVLTFSEFITSPVDNADIVFMLNVPEFNRDSEDIIKNILNKGKDIVICLGDNVNTESYNNYLKDIISGNLKDVINISRSKVFLYEKHEINKVFTNDMFKHVKFSKIYELLGYDKSDVLLGLNANNTLYPLMIEQNYLNNPEYGRVVLFTSSVDRNWNNLALKPIYLPLWHQVIKYLENLLSNVQKHKKNINIGERYYKEFDLLNIPKWVEITYPNGNIKRIFLENKFETRKVYIDFKDTFLPGVYKLRYKFKDKWSIEFFAVNIDKSEFLSKKIDFKKIKSISNSKLTVLDGWNKDFNKNLKKLMAGIRFFKYIIILILILCLIEVLFIL